MSLNSGPSFSGANLGSPAGTIKASETANYIAFYIIEQSAVDAGGFTNQVLSCQHKRQEEQM